MKKCLLLFSLLFSINQLFAQVIDSISPNYMRRGDYYSTYIYGTGTNYISAADAILVNGSDTIHSSYVWTYGNANEFSVDFSIPCNATLGLWNLFTWDPISGWLLKSNAVTVDSLDFGFPIYVSNVGCRDGNNGSIYVDEWGGQAQSPSENRGGPSYGYYWYPNGETTNEINNLSPGTYSVIITDLSTGCTDSIGFVLINPPVMNVYWTKVNADCGQQNGMAFIDSITGGYGPYTASWMPQEYSGDSIMFLAPGNYELYVSDSFGCSFHYDYTITENLSFNFTTTPIACGDNDGIATINMLNGVAPFNVLWSNGDSGLSADSLSTGTYTVLVSDANSCSGDGTFTITGTNAPIITSVITGSPSCNGLTNGSIDITVSGGVAPYSFAWSTGATTEDINNIPAGVYEVLVTDANGCSSGQCISVAEQTKLQFDYIYTYGSTCGFSDGYAEAFVVGGTPPITIQWDANAGNVTGNWAGGLLPNVYTVTATDALGCTDVIQIPVSDYDGPYYLYDSSSVATCGLSDGAVYITSGGGYGGPYTYEWSDASTNEDLTGVSAGKYFITITDALGCKGISEAYVDGTLPLGQNICLVTVDSLTGNNLVVWEKATVTDIDHYNIYREACGNINGFVFVGSVDYDSLSQFIDVGANAMVKSWRYRMTAVDVCGTESEVSPVHKTIYLSATKLANNNNRVTWDNYSGFTYTEQILWRYHNSTNWIVIDTLPVGVNLYTDTSVLAADSVQYFVEVYPGYTCTSTRAENHNSSRSNRGTLAPPNSSSINDANLNNALALYPNPNNGQFTIGITSINSGKGELAVYDLSGRLVYNQNVMVNSGYNQLQLDLPGIAKGLYYVKFVLGNEYSTTKMIKQ